MSSTDCVRRLCARLGVEARQRRRFDWATVEGGLGLLLPADYKLLAETLPEDAAFGQWQLNRPGDFDHPDDDFLGFYAYRLEDMRHLRAIGYEIPHPIYPEPGGLLPWARGSRMEPAFWLTGGDDPERWPIVIVDADFQRWRTLPGPACQFLLDAAGGLAVSDASRYRIEDVEKQRAPHRSFWGKPGAAADEFGALAASIGRAPTTGASLDWNDVHEFMGVTLPADYRTFVDRYGPGRVGDVVVTAPGAGGAVDMFGLLARTIDKKRTSNLRVAAPVCPEPDGLIAWGETDDGWILGWAPSGTDPDRWGVVVFRAGGPLAHLPDASFSQFLRRYVEHDRYVGEFMDRPPWPEPA